MMLEYDNKILRIYAGSKIITASVLLKANTECNGYCIMNVSTECNSLTVIVGKREFQLQQTTLNYS